MRRALFAMWIASAACGWVACSSFGSNDPTPANPTDAALVDTSATDGGGASDSEGGLLPCDPAGPWQRHAIPRPTAGDSGESIEAWGSLTQDQLTLYVSSAVPPSIYFRIYRVTRGTPTSTFGAAELVDLGGTQHDQHPAISPDGTEIVFASDRLASQAYRIYRARRTSVAVPFSAPELLFPRAGTFVDRTPSLAPNGDIWFATTRFGTQEKIAVARKLPNDGGFADPVAVDELALPLTKHIGPYLTRDSRALFLSRLKPNTDDQYEVWLARRTSLEAPFGLPEQIPSLSVFPQTFVTWMSEDGCTAIVSYVGPFVGQLYFATQ